MNQTRTILSIMQDVALTVQSQQSVNVTSGGSQLHLRENSLNISTGPFHIHKQGQSLQDSPPLFSFSPENVTVRAGRLVASGTLGIQVEGPVETAEVLYITCQWESETRGPLWWFRPPCLSGSHSAGWVCKWCGCVILSWLDPSLTKWISKYNYVVNRFIALQFL